MRATALRRNLDAAWPVWLLVDPLVREPLPLNQGEFSADPDRARAELAEARAQACGRTTYDIPLDSSIKLLTHQYPYLVELQGHDDPWLDYSLAKAQSEHAEATADGLAGAGRAVCTVSGWLQSTADIEDLRQGLAEIMKLRTTVSTPARYLRLSDRRTLDWLIALLGRAALAAVLGPVQRWLWLDSLGRIARLDHEAPGEHEPALKALTFDARLWADFQQARWVHPALARWLGEWGRQADRSSGDRADLAVDLDLDLERTLHRLLGCVKEAHALARRHPDKLPKDDDVTAWAALQLQHADLAKRPAVDEWLHGPTDAPFNIQCHTLARVLDAPPIEPHALRVTP